MSVWLLTFEPCTNYDTIGVWSGQYLLEVEARGLARALSKPADTPVWSQYFVCFESSDTLSNRRVAVGVLPVHRKHALGGVSTEYMYVCTSWKRHHEGAGSSCSPPSVNFTTAHDATFGNAVILILLRFGVEKLGTVFHGPGDLGLSPNTSVFGVLALDADGAIDGASMPRVLESPRS